MQWYKLGMVWYNLGMVCVRPGQSVDTSCAGRWKSSQISRASLLAIAGDMPLHMACRMGAGLPMIRILAAASSSINVPGVRGLTPLHEAVEGGRREVIVHLIEVSGADVAAESDERLTPVDIASSNPDVPQNVREYLEDMGRRGAAMMI